MLLALFALAAGFCSAFAPCIAPILPLYVLRGATPWRLAGGVAAAVALTMLASVYLLQSLGAAGRWLGVVGVIGCGIALLWERPSLWASRWAGIGVGLAWAPCLGPIAAGILSIGGIVSPILVVCYAVGLGVGVWMCATAARRFRAALSGPGVRRTIGVLMILVGIGLGVGVSGGASERIQAAFPAWSGVLWRWQDRVIDGLPVRVAPAMRGEWRDEPPELRGRRSLVVFWSYTCPACRLSMPKLAGLARRSGVQLVLVHSPQYAGATDRDRIRRSLREYGLEDAPLLYDDRRETMRRWGATAWPWHALVDERGEIVSTRSGTRLEALSGALSGGEGPQESDFGRESEEWELRGEWTPDAGAIVAGAGAGIRLRDGGSLWVERRTGGFASFEGARLPLSRSGWIRVEGWVDMSRGVRISTWRTGDESVGSETPDAVSRREGP